MRAPLLQSQPCYANGVGGPGDAAVVAVDRASGKRVGAAWYRLLTEEAPGYGFVAPGVPELGMGVAEAFRGRGVGGALLGALMERARAEGFGALSLSVEDGNDPAARLYERTASRGSSASATPGP